MERNRLEKAADRASEILTVANALCAPVDPFALGASEGSLIFIGDNFKQRFDGQLEYHGAEKKFLLFYNTKYNRGMPNGQHHPRTRFSVAHELGHYYLEAHHAYLRRGGKSHQSRGEFANDVTIEREADAFAAGLLLPAKLVRPLVNEDQVSLAVIEELAGTFGTSLVSTALRCVALSDFPCAIAGLRAGAVAWCVPSQPLIDAGFYPPAGGSAPSTSAREQWTSFAGGTGRKAKGASIAREWFRTYERDDLGQVHVTEFFLPVPTMETLIVLLTIPPDALPDDDEGEED